MLDKLLRQQYLADCKRRLQEIEAIYPLASMKKILELMDERGAPQWYITYVTAFKIVRQAEVGHYKPISRSTTHRRMKDFYHAFCVMWIKNQELSDREVIELTLNTPAPSFYATANTINKARSYRN